MEGDVTNRELRTVAQACAQLGCSPRKIQKLAQEGKLERVRFGKKMMISARSLNALIDEVLTGDSLYKKGENA